MDLDGERGRFEAVLAGPALDDRGENFQQLARLDYILDELRSRLGPQQTVRSINLSLGGRQVPVAFEVPVPAPTSATSTRSGTVVASSGDHGGKTAPKQYSFFRPQSSPVPNSSRDN
jgi:hypothetical protein